MLRSLTTLVAFLCLGPPPLPAPPVVKPLPQVVALALPPENLKDVPITLATASEPEDSRPVAAFRPRLRSAFKLLAHLDLLVHNQAERYGVDEKLVKAVLRQESGGNPLAVSPKGAQGLMQLMPGTAEMMGVKDPFDPEDNLAGGIKYLKLCLERFAQNLTLALAAYNAGPGAVERYGGCPPYRETENFVAQVLANYRGEIVSFSRRPLSRLPSAPVAKTQAPPPGLDWRVPTPTWKVAVPQARIEAPRWKIGPPRGPQVRSTRGEAPTAVAKSGPPES